MADLVKALFVLLLGTLVSACTPDAATPALQVKAIGALERFAPFEAVSGQDRVELFAARNEYEGFQLVVSAGKTGISGVTVSLSPLQSETGDVLDRQQIFRQRYVRVSQPSPFSPYEAQFWPDILLPAGQGENAATPGYRAFPHNLLAGENLPVWVDIFVPADAVPGQYSGSITVSADGIEAVELPVSLHVWNFTLPQRSPLRTVFGTNSYRLAEIYGFERDAGAAASNRLIRSWNDFMLDHYLSPEDFWDASPGKDADGLPDFTQQFAGLGDVNANMRHYMQVKQASAYTYVFADSYPFADPLGEDRVQAQAFMREYARWCGEQAGAERCYTDPSFVDEPDTPKAYRHARRWGEFFDATAVPAGERIRYQVSEPPLNEQPELGSLTGAVDVWIPKFYDLWRDVDYLQTNIAGQRREAGEEIWAYTALVTDFRQYRQLNPQADVLGGSYPPVWQLDFPAINYRIPTWFLHRYGVTGLGYWDTIAWHEGTDIWNDAASFISSDPPGIIFNGDGLLVYPGFRQKNGFDGPLASLRLKWIRESVEDYMYVDQLYAIGEADFARQQIARIARHLGDWDNDPALLMQVRRALGERLDAWHERQQGQGAP